MCSCAKSWLSAQEGCRCPPRSRHHNLLRRRRVSAGPEASSLPQTGAPPRPRSSGLRGSRVTLERLGAGTGKRQHLPGRGRRMTAGRRQKATEKRLMEKNGTERSGLCSSAPQARAERGAAEPARLCRLRVRGGAGARAPRERAWQAAGLHRSRRAPVAVSLRPAARARERAVGSGGRAGHRTSRRQRRSSSPCSPHDRGSQAASAGSCPAQRPQVSAPRR